MTKHIGVNIGPVVKTLSLARRPRELWSASYLFSFLMEYIVDEADKQGKIIAPKEWEKTEEYKDLPVGLYPDRIYVRPNEGVVADDILKPAWDRFCNSLGVTSCYFNLMHTTCDRNSEVAAVTELNRRLDLLELCVQAPDSDPQEEIMRIIQEGKFSTLYKAATRDHEFSVETLAEISAAQLKMVVNEDIWKKFSSEARKEDGKGDPYSVLGGDIMSFHRYFCVIQADGDNMGKTLTNDSLKDGAISEISEALWQFGVNATKEITEYAGMPIYAGGDDLLFLAPVRGKGSVSIFELLDRLEDCFQVVRDACKASLPELEEQGLLPSLSFGVSICYYKHPLYEALESARHLLFDVAKGVDDKKAIAWKLEKHSGESFDASFSRKKTGLDEAFKNVVKQTVDGQTVTRAIHKCKNNWKLLTLCLQSDDNNRLDSFFKTILEETPQNRDYFEAVKKLMTELFKVQKPEDDDNLKKYSNSLYSMLRTAKFINGEDVKDE